MDREYLHKVKSNLRHAEFALSEPDEQEMNMAAYHIQQAVELGLKQILKDYGVKYSKIHIIGNLINLLPKDQEILSDGLLDSLGLLAPTLTEWKASSRYTEGYLPVRRILVMAYDVTKDFLSELEEGFSKLDAKSKQETEDSEVLDDNENENDGILKLDFK